MPKYSNVLLLAMRGFNYSIIADLSLQQNTGTLLNEKAQIQKQLMPENVDCCLYVSGL
jgi:hypothetical protein